MKAPNLQFTGVTESDVHICQSRKFKKKRVMWARYEKIENGENWGQLGTTRSLGEQLLASFAESCHVRTPS